MGEGAQREGAAYRDVSVPLSGKPALECLNASVVHCHGRWEGGVTLRVAAKCPGEARLTWSGEPAHIASVITPGH